MDEFIDFLKCCRENRIDGKERDELEMIEKIFNDLDRDNDLVVKKGRLIENMKMNGKSILRRGCRFIESINRVLTYEIVLNQME